MLAVSPAIPERAVIERFALAGIAPLWLHLTAKSSGPPAGEPV
jgi:hypothetical protein